MTKCSLCGQKIQGITEEEARRKLVSHIDDDCTTATTLRSWEEQGIYKEMVGLVRLRSLDKVLRRLLKRYSIDEIRETLEMMEDEQDG